MRRGRLLPTVRNEPRESEADRRSVAELRAPGPAPPVCAEQTRRRPSTAPAAPMGSRPQHGLSPVLAGSQGSCQGDTRARPPAEGAGLAAVIQAECQRGVTRPTADAHRATKPADRLSRARLSRPRRYSAGGGAGRSPAVRGVARPAGHTKKPGSRGRRALVRQSEPIVSAERPNRLHRSWSSDSRRPASVAERRCRASRPVRDHSQG